MKPLIGQQLALLPEVAPYLLTNPAECAVCLTCDHLTQRLTVACPACESCKTRQEHSSSPEHLMGGLYRVEQEALLFRVAEQPQDYGTESSQRPLPPERAFSIGDQVKILAVQPHQSKGWIGRQGTVHKLSRTRVWVKLQGRNESRPVELPLPVACLELCPTIRRRQPRRYSAKGHASGWLEERQGNKKRKTPSLSYYYGWFEEGTCRKRYVPAGKVYRVNEMLHQRRPVAEILAFLGEKS